jgi:hypothetical protein
MHALHRGVASSAKCVGEAEIKPRRPHFTFAAGSKRKFFGWWGLNPDIDL